MPLIFRAMIPDESGNRPQIGDDATSLGVRVPKDITVVEETVRPTREGMSVSPSPEHIPPHRIPKKFVKTLSKTVIPTGSNKLYCWSMGAGPFIEGPISERLQLMLEPEGSETHGVVAPTNMMSFQEYKIALEETLALWKMNVWPWEVMTE